MTLGRWVNITQTSVDAPLHRPLAMDSSVVEGLFFL